MIYSINVLQKQTCLGVEVTGRAKEVWLLRGKKKGKGKGEEEGEGEGKTEGEREREGKMKDGKFTKSYLEWLRDNKHWKRQSAVFSVLFLFTLNSMISGARQMHLSIWL